MRRESTFQLGNPRLNPAQRHASQALLVAESQAFQNLEVTISILNNTITEELTHCES